MGHMVRPTNFFFFLAPFPSVGMRYGRGWYGAVELGQEWANA